MRVGLVTILDEARSAYQAGLCILPVAADGSKRPDVRTWTRYQRERPTPEQMRAFQFERRHGFGMIAGLVSGRRGAWDFDCSHTYRAFVAAADASGLGEVVQRIEAGYCDMTPALSGPQLDRQERQAADEWLRELLADGSMPTREIQAAARGAGFGWRTVERAKTRLAVRTALLGYGSAGRWHWHLPETASSHDQTPEAAMPFRVAVSDEETNKTGPDIQRPPLTPDVAVSSRATSETGVVSRERTRF